MNDILQKIAYREMFLKSPAPEDVKENVREQLKELEAELAVLELKDELRIK